MEQDAWTPDRPPPERIEIGDLVLQRWRPEDAVPHCAAVVDSVEHLRPWMPWSEGYDITKSEEYLRDVQVEWEARRKFDFRITARPGSDLDVGPVLGSAGLMARQGPAVLEIGYWVHVGATRRGVALHSAAALTRAALELPGVERVQIHHDDANLASAAIPARLGYVRRDGFVPGPPGREHERHRCWVMEGSSDPDHRLGLPGTRTWQAAPGK